MNGLILRFTKEGREIVEIQRRLARLDAISHQISRVHEVMEILTKKGGEYNDNANSRKERTDNRRF